MKILSKISEEIVPLSGKQHIVLLIIIACVFQFVLFYAPVLADETNQKINTALAISIAPIGLEQITTETADNLIQELPANRLPLISNKPIVIAKESTHTMTAYNSEAAQTDDSPCITANNFNVCEHGEEDTIAANFLPFGTKVMIPELFGDRVFIVRDRMNKRYTSRVDVWMKDHQAALNFGIKVAKIQILE